MEYNDGQGYLVSNAVYTNSRSSNLKAKGKALASTGLFGQWSHTELFDLACLSQIRRFPKGKEIIKQDEGFHYLCVLTKGLCEVTKVS